jgi:integrase
MPHKDNKVVEYLTQGDARRFLNVVRQWPDADVCNMLVAAYFTGMRRGELFRLM